MTQEEKDLLIKDLCGRSPYNIMVDYDSNIYILNEIDPACKDIDYITVRIQDVERLMCAKSVMIENIKPYLRPLSNMTKDEKEELKQYLDAEELDCSGFGYIEGGTLENYVSNIPYSICSYVIDWLLAHHFDYRGLIDRGLALEAKEGMYDRN